jgi:alanyl-tRNA synthetase
MRRGCDNAYAAIAFFRFSSTLSRKPVVGSHFCSGPSVGSGIAAIAATGEDGKASLVVAVTPDLTNRFNAIDLVRLGSTVLGGKGGGGRPDMAQAGGPDGAKAKEALTAVEEAIRARA